MSKIYSEKISARAAWALYSAATSIGLDVDVFTFYPDLIPENKDGFVSTEHHAGFARYIYSQPSDTIGLRLGCNLPFEGLGLWGFLLRSSPTYGDMLIRAERYIRIVNQYSEFHLETRGDSTAMICPHPNPSPFGPREQVVFSFLTHWIAWGRQLCRESIKPQEAKFQCKRPGDVTPFVEFFDCKITFDSNEDSLLFDDRTMKYPLVDGTTELAKEFESYASTLIERMSGGDELVSCVRTAIEELLAGGTVRETAVANRLAMTTRTLHRKLNNQNTSFRELRDSVLKQRAKNLLRHPEIPLPEVAFLLGYSDASAFYRAFKRWTGYPPGAWREHAT